MSEENVEIVRRFWPGTIDVVAVVSDPQLLAVIRKQLEPFVSPELETVLDPRHAPMGIPTTHNRAGRLVGIEGFIAVWREWASAWESWVVTPNDFIAVGDERVLIPMEIKGRSRTQQVEFSVEGANLVTIREGRLTRVELFFQREEALEAAGLSE